MNVTRAFLRRDWRIWSSYKLAVLLQVVSVLAVILLTYFVGSALGSRSTGSGGHGPDYVAFVLAGIAFTDVFLSTLNALPQAIRDSQLNGTLEPMLITPIPAFALMAASAGFRTVQSLMRLIIYLVVATLALGYWHQANPITTLLVFVPGCLTFVLLGLIAGSFVLVFKQGDPIVLGYVGLSGLLGGTVFPTSVLPAWAQPLTSLLPLSHALTGIRLGLAGALPSAVLLQASVLGVFSLGLVPVAMASLHWALARAKQEGSLVQY
jgi:ABC-2 type transport system permease protein